MNNINVMILDSGIGGLSIAEHVKQLCPHTNLIYIADTAGFPYGNKTAQQIEQRVLEVTQAAAKRYQPQLIIIGCNTASTVALARLRAEIDLPFIGVVPAIKPACHYSQSKSIGVLATGGTISTQYTQQLIADFAINCQVTLFGSTNLASLAELKLSGSELNVDLLIKDLEALFCSDQSNKMDTVVLACTHFPLLLPELQMHSPKPVRWLDSGNAIARRLLQLESSLALTKFAPAAAVFCTTKNEHNYSHKAIEAILGPFNTEHLKI